MAFTPKFFDLVRNSTTITGTGPVTLGSAVTGFTSLSAVLAAGDQFYYCIQGVDKPQEREVGRGTMQANGTIARQPIAGSATNFTTGAKTIALVAAAEWFARLDGIASATAPSDAASRTALAARTVLSGAVQLTETGREGVFTFSASNLSAKVAADPRQGIYVAPASDPSGTSGAWVRRHAGVYNVMWFGAKADFVSDDLPAFEGALQAIQAEAPAGTRQGNRLLVPAGRYYLSGALNLHQAIYLHGAGSAQPGGSATILRFGKNVDGIIINHSNTHGNGLGTQGDGSGSIIEGIQLWGGNVNVNPSTGAATSFAAGDSLSGSGIRIRGAFVGCKDVASYFFGGDGFNIVATSGGADAVNGNASSFYLERCQAQYNRGNGYTVGGTDANAGKVTTCSAISNGGSGFFEFSFLGNTYDACHARDNGVADPIGSNGPTGTCRYPAGSSNFYYMVAFQDTLAKTTVPGTNDAVWRAFGGHPQCKTWVTGLDWVLGAPYVTNPTNTNGRNVFTGCYAESAQAPIQSSAPTVFLGGLLTEVGFDKGSTALFLGAEAGGITVPSINGASGGQASPLIVSAIGRNWDPVAPGGAKGALHLPVPGGAITFGEATGNALSGIYTLQSDSFGTRMYLATADSYQLAAKTAVAIDEHGNVDIPRGKLSIAGVPLSAVEPVQTVAGTSYVATASDAGSYLRFTSATAVAFTIPPDSALSLPVGSEIDGIQAGAGALSLVAGSGVTLNAANNDLTLAGQFSAFTVKKVAANVWDVVGRF